MAFKTILYVLIAAAVCIADPKDYYVRALPAGQAPGIDGYLDEWPEEYYLDSLYSDLNAFCEDDSPWTPAEFQMRVYAAHDSEKVYYGVKVIRDDSYIIGRGWWEDNMKINPGGQAAAFYLNSDESDPNVNPSCPYEYGETLWAASKTYASDGFPIYEFALSRSIIDHFNMKLFVLSVGTEDRDFSDSSAGIMNQLSLGAEYKGFKRDWGATIWDNPMYYATYHLTDTLGPPLYISKDRPRVIPGNASLSIRPNPFNSLTRLSYNAAGPAEIVMYDIKGAVINRFALKDRAGQMVWDGRDMRGQRVPDGIYFAGMTGHGRARVVRMLKMR